MKAVLLVNYGGPNSPEEVKQYLKNIFMDQQIIPMQFFFRKIFATIISNYRKNYSKKQYDKIGYGRLLEMTERQAQKLEEFSGIKTYIGMMYSPPFIKDTVEKMKKDGIKKFTVIPLFPQYSITTTYSVYKMLEACNKDNNFKFVRSFCENEAFIDSFVEKINIELEKFEKTPTMIFSAHGVPDNPLDPYKYEVKLTVEKIMSRFKGYEYLISFQSKVGPMKWLMPNTIDVVAQYAKTHRYLLMVPVSFVADNLETLYELHILNKEVAIHNGAVQYFVASCPNDSDLFIKALVELI
ncbi:MAG: ferrochelatase [bacterium]|nr:ferrochelatase [bacterium]